MELAPAARRDPPPPGGAPGAGTFASVAVDLDDAVTDEAAVAIGEDWLVRATNRALLACAFLGSNMKAIPSLPNSAFERPIMVDIVDDTGRARSLTVRPLEVKPSLAVKTAAISANGVADHFAEFSGPFKACERLWLDVLSALYEDRLREAIVFARAFLEVAWSVAAKEAVARRKAQAPNKEEVHRVLDAFLKSTIDSDRASMPTRLTMHSEALFGFSFAEHWDVDKVRWGHLDDFNKKRNKIAHGAFEPNFEETSRCVSIAWDAFIELKRLHAELTHVPRTAKLNWWLT